MALPVCSSFVAARCPCARDNLKECGAFDPNIHMLISISHNDHFIRPRISGDLN